MSQAINQLPGGTPTSSGVLIPYFDPSQGLDMSCSASVLLALLGSASGQQTVYASPNTSGYTINVSPVTAGGNVWLLITPLAGYSALTIVLPIGYNQQEIVVNCTQSVTTLTVTGATVGAGAQPVNGAPTTLGANGHFRLKFDAVNASWYCVG